jgi:hypothetical protein
MVLQVPPSPGVVCAINYGDVLLILLLLVITSFNLNSDTNDGLHKFKYFEEAAQRISMQHV